MKRRPSELKRSLFSITIFCSVVFCRVDSTAGWNSSDFQVNSTAAWNSSNFQVCGKILTGNGGIFQSPNFPYNYPDNTRCVWTITVDPGFQVRVDLSEISLEEADDCSFDYILIRDGNNQSAEILAEKCGFSILCPITSTGNEMFIEFKSDGSVTRSGFQATWSAVNSTTALNDTNCQVCRKILTGNGGIFQSPNFPYNYPDNTRCVWTITVDPGFQVRVDFSEFSLEGTDGCSFDYVFIRDGNNQSAEILAEKCGFSILCPITSTGNEMFIEFKSDGSVTRSGFQATWSAVNSTTALNNTNCQDNSTATSTTPSSVDNSTATSTSSSVGCSQTLSGNEGTLQSPNYPSDYPNNARCVWTIETDPGTRVSLNFSAFSVEDGRSCRYDSLVVRDGNSSSSPLLRKLCGQERTVAITASGNVLFLEFRSDRSMTKNGFLAQWSVDNSTATSTPFSVGCSRTLSGNEGSLQSPNYPSDYPNNARCVWTIETDPGTRVSLNFSAFSLEDGRNCRHDSLVVRDGNSSSSPLLRKLCGQERTVAITASGNNLFLEFRSDRSVTKNGFLAQWSVGSSKKNFPEGCQKVISECLSRFWAASFQPVDYGKLARTFFICVRNRCPETAGIPAFDNA
ncbi:hypothetical protein RRG08_035183 [Elysia crispata]|uniref:CUB domain-containing protein n=1 Tax=Elysia crispata TaxID=231223 RepID=A0AAE1DQJ7_9GAST|nr:hypothetical protein RRG08_035183 [Elysia crispata]